MDLESLKKAWDDAVEALAAKPDDEVLKEAVETAKAAYEEAKKKADEESEDDDPDPKDGDSKWDDKTKKYIKKLRDENARNRTGKKSADDRLKSVLKALGLEEDPKPEEKLKVKEAETQTLAFRNAILESAVENGIAKDDLEYYEFLISKAAGSLEEGEELSEEALAEIVAKVGKRGSANTGVGTGKGKKPAPPPGDSDEVSLDAFCKMSVTQKSDLYLKKPDVYKRLVEEAKAKKRLI